MGVRRFSSVGSKLLQVKEKLAERGCVFDLLPTYDDSGARPLEGDHAGCELPTVAGTAFGRSMLQ